MLSMRIKVPRCTVLALSEQRREYELACVGLQHHQDEPDEIAVVMFSRIQNASRFIDANGLQGWKPAYIAYPEVRGLLVTWAQQEGATRVVVDYFNDDRRQLVKSFRIADAVMAIDAADLETGDPIVVEGNIALPQSRQGRS